MMERSNLIPILKLFLHEKLSSGITCVNCSLMLDAELKTPAESQQ